MFKRIMGFFRWRKDLEQIKFEVMSFTRKMEYLFHNLEKNTNTIEAIRKKSNEDYVNLYDIRQMVSKISADVSSISLEMAMKPSVGEQPFVKVNVGVDPATFQAVD